MLPKAKLQHFEPLCSEQRRIYRTQRFKNIDPDQISDLVSCTLLSSTEERQTLLETVEVETRLKHLIHFLMAEIQSNRKDDGHE